MQTRWEATDSEGFITFRISCRWCKMYSGHTHLCV